MVIWIESILMFEFSDILALANYIKANLTSMEVKIAVYKLI